MNTTLVKEVFDRECSSLVIDQTLAHALYDYQTRFVTKNRDHIEFFGGHLLGVSPVKFLQSDQNHWFGDILNVDAEALTHALSDFRELNNERIVSSDAMNLSCAWLAHKFLTSNLLPEVKHSAMINIMLVLQYKFLTSRLHRLFPYPADPAIAAATYASLSHKYAIKQFGSWSALFLARADEITRAGSLHYKTLETFVPDKAIVYMVNDIQGRIRDMLKNIYGEHKRIAASGVRISTTSNVAEFDGESVLKDRTKNVLQYKRYLDSVVADPRAFIRDELLSVIFQLMSSSATSDRLIRETLLWMSTHYRQGAHNQITAVLEECLIHAFGYLNEERAYVRSNPDLPSLLARLKGVYSSSRSTDSHLITLRTKTEVLVTQATGNKSPAVVAATRTSVLLYLVGRTFTMQHFG